MRAETKQTKNSIILKHKREIHFSLKFATLQKCNFLGLGKNYEPLTSMVSIILDRAYSLINP